MKPLPAWLVKYIASRPNCERCFKCGVYADPKMVLDTRKRIAISPQSVVNGWHTEPCPLCGANAKPK